MDYEEFKKLLKMNDLTLKKFAELSNTSYSTCLKWGKNNRAVSDWVESWLKMYMELNELRTYKESIQTLMNGLNPTK